MKSTLALRTLMCAMLAASAGVALAGTTERDPGQQTSQSSAQTGASSSSPTTTTGRTGMNSRRATANNMQSNSDMAAAQEKFNALDTNHDGMIDRQEASASKPLASEFKKLDSDNDGKLSVTEFSAANNLAAIKVKTKDNKGYH